MHCEEGEKLFKFVQVAQGEAGKFRLPAATEPLGIDTPPGNPISLEWRKKRRDAEDSLEKAFYAFLVLDPFFLFFTSPLKDLPPLKQILIYRPLDRRLVLTLPPLDTQELNNFGMLLYFLRINFNKITNPNTTRLACNP